MSSSKAKTEKVASEGLNKIGTTHTAEKCGSCLKKVSENEPAVQCEIRDFWFHSTCQRIPESMYEALQQYNEDLHWYCNSCKNGIGKLLSAITTMQNKIETLEIEFKEIKQSTTGVRSEIEQLKTDSSKMHLSLTERETSNMR